MKILLLCGYFFSDDELIKNSKKAIEYSANVFQQKLIEGFDGLREDFSVISAPFIGAYPNAYKKAFYKGEQKDGVKTVSFFNLWGIRNLSRTKNLKKSAKKFIKDSDEQKLIVVYSPHTPFLQTAVWAKKKDPRIKISLIVPDLPEYMNLEKKQSFIYKLLKKQDVKNFNKLLPEVDSFTVLAPAMKEALKVGERPCLIKEGIVTNKEIERAEKESVKDNEKYIVYAGKLNERFGIKNLVDAFIKTSAEDLKLVILGEGDSSDYVKEKAKADRRINFIGQVEPKIASEWMERAYILVNPRQDKEEFTKYSFPSKNIEYLLRCDRVICYKLKGMKEEYKNFIIFPKDDSVDSLKEAIESANNHLSTKEQFIRYARENLLNHNICFDIINMHY